MEKKKSPTKLAEIADSMSKKIGSKEWILDQVWTKKFRKFWGVKITPFKRSEPKLRRNSICECGSGLKVKHCDCKKTIKPNE